MPSSPTSERRVRLVVVCAALTAAPACWEGPRVGPLNEAEFPMPGPEVDAGVGSVDAGSALPFSRLVTTIFVPNCADSSCHGGNPPPFAPMSLDATAAYATLVNRPSSQVPSMLRVAPGDPDESYLMKKLLGTARSVGGVDSTMPLLRPPLSAEQLELIRSWIARGAPND